MVDRAARRTLRLELKRAKLLGLGLQVVRDLLTMLAAWGRVSSGQNPTTNVFRPTPEPGTLTAGAKGMTMYKLTCCVAVAVAGVGGAAVGDVFHVPGDFPTVQAALLAALGGDEIIVAPGTYNEAIFFNGHDVTLRSSDGPDVTIIDATGLNSNTVRCILGEGPNTVLEGFTITGGVSYGMLCDSSMPTIRNCRFVGNAGAGMRNDFSRPTVIDCVFANNGNNGMENFTSSNATVTNCIFTGNDLSGMLNQSSAPIVTSCTFTANTFWGMNNNTSFPTLISCLIVDSLSGGGMTAHTGSDATLINCTISGNVGRGVDLFSSNVVLTNCIVWANGAQSIGGPGTAVVSHCDIEFGWPGSDFSILADPMFVDPVNGDYRLQAASPCIDLGNNAEVPVAVNTDLDGNPRFVDRPATPDCPQPGANCGLAPIVDMGAYEWACPFDLDASGSVDIPDLLALLAAWGTNVIGPPDFNGDGSVNVPDLLMLLAAWGACP